MTRRFLLHPCSVVLLLAVAACDRGAGAREATRPLRVADARTPAPPRAIDAGPARPAPAVKDQLTVRFFAAGHADAILLSTSAGAHVLIDAGRGDKAFLGDNLAERRIAPLLRKEGIRKLDAWFVTHPHWDHFGDPGALKAAVSLPRILTNLDGISMLPLFFAALLPNAQLELSHAGKSHTFGRLVLDVLHPPANAPKVVGRRNLYQHNNRSLVIRATYGKVRFLLPGDLHYEGEGQLLATRPDVRAQVLKLGHHGLGSGSTAWLKAVRPTWAVATCGDKWKGGQDQLSKEILDRLARQGIKLLRTDKVGDVLFTTDGETLDLQTFPALAPKGARAP